MTTRDSTTHVKILFMSKQFIRAWEEDDQPLSRVQYARVRNTTAAGGLKCNGGQQWKENGSPTTILRARGVCVCARLQGSRSMSNRKHRDNQEICARKVRELAQAGVNKHCFECNQPGVTYIDITVGCFVCTSCSGMLWVKTCNCMRLCQVLH